ncbi:glycosyltransferase family protein [Occallatibacter riparius]|uniref:Glycosyltransferase RgtA/B/C/D-like domain-containing protein n=1 Tax=Occallatibacter riparius TaxID=1002689 RepID=A0A9J7BY90_9BACT|nr:hypothetical protein [Occallatibacter riparius]UWZ86349.1 hypothetical protein MOP44_10495 [Occallatibacter riparius]
MENGAESGGGMQYRQETQQWRLRDAFAAAILFMGSAAFVGWQNTRVAVLWDLGYLLDTSWRIALGQMPYRDFPLVHAPVTFLIQAGLIKLFGRHMLVPVIYAAVAGGLGSVIAWRIVLQTLRGAWWISLALSAPLIVVGIYAIYPYPIYDCDCSLAILVAMLLLMRVDESRGWVTPFCVGAACVLPLFVKQNMGLPFLAAVTAAVIALLVTHGSVRSAIRSSYAVVLLGIIAAIFLALGLLSATAGLHNYIHWTVEFAAQRRMPGLSAMLSVYEQPSLLWMAPMLAAGLALCWSRFAHATWGKILACALMAAPFVYSLIFLLMEDDADERADNLLALWPVWMLAAGAIALWSLRRGLNVRAAIPFIVLAGIHGSFLSQQLWGSTYALWPLLMVLIAVVLAEMPRAVRPAAIGVAVVACVIFATCGGLYAASLERLNYVDIPEDAPVELAQTTALRGAADRGPYLTNLDELIAFADREIPAGDALVLLPGEDPFYFATGRVPRFPVTLFDPATDPYSPAQLMAEARRRDVRWVIVKRVLQSKANAMPGFDETLQFVRRDFALFQSLAGYDVYRRK